MAQVVVNGASYSWHKIEMVNLDGTNRRTIYNMAERPRGLYLDVENGYHIFIYIFFTSVNYWPQM